MTKNSAKTIVDLIRNPRSNAYKDLCAASEEKGIQSDVVAALLRDEFKSVLVDLLKGNLEPANEKLNRYATYSRVVIQAAATRRTADLLNSKKVRVGEREFNLVTLRPSEASAEELLYDLLRRTLVSGDIQRISLCQRCEKIFYRNSLKGRFCGNDCRWAHFNSYEERSARYERLLNKQRGRPTKVTRRGARKITTGGTKN